MTLHNAFEMAAGVIRKFETSDHISNVSLSDGELLQEEAIELECSVDLPLLEDLPTDVSLEVTEVKHDDDGNVVLDLGVNIPLSNADAVNSAEELDGSTDVLERHSADDPNESVPAYKDPDALLDVYERCDTFVEMTEALEVDVTPETVRTYMVKHDIHEPEKSSSEASGDSDDEGTTPVRPLGGDNTDQVDSQELADDNDERTSHVSGTQRGEEVAEAATDGGNPPTFEDELPPDIEADELIDAVRSAKTIYDVRRELDYDRERTVELLRKFDLLELVTGRLSKCSDRVATTDEITTRLMNTS